MSFSMHDSCGLCTTASLLLKVPEKLGMHHSRQSECFTGNDLLDSKRQARSTFPPCRDRSDSNIVSDASRCMGRYRQSAIVCPFCWDNAWGLSTVTAANCCHAAVLPCLPLAPADDASHGGHHQI